MRKTKVTLLAQTILQIEAGTHDAVRDGGNLYILLQQEEGIEDGGASEDAPEPKKATAKAPAKTPAKAPTKAEVLDDTQEEEQAPAPKKATPSRAKKPAPKPEPVETDEPQEIPEDEWGDLEAGTSVFAQLNMEGEDGEKLWEAEIVGWKKPKGSRDEKLYVKFIEDGQEDYLRDGDKLFTNEEEGL